LFFFSGIVFLISKLTDAYSVPALKYNKNNSSIWVDREKAYDQEALGGQNMPSYTAISSVIAGAVRVKMSSPEVG
jgi:hypothetical protein